MDEIGIVSTFNPLDALESISKLYSARQLSRVEILKIQAQTQSFNRWLLEQRNENKEKRAQLVPLLESCRVQLESLIDKILQNPEMADVYKDIIELLLNSNNQIAAMICEIRIKSK